MSDVTECPHCLNRMGFVFGTCFECGWNYLDHSFHTIKVRTEDLPADRDSDLLILRHALRTNRMCAVRNK